MDEQSKSFLYGKSYADYQFYIEEHKKNIESVWDDIQQHLKEEYWLDDYIWHNIDDLISCHDNSKYSDREFERYRQYFYPIDNTEKDKKLFLRGWLHHQKANKHHWEYWVLIKDKGRMIFNMPFIYAFEMMCDWAAMSYKFKDLPSDYYNKNKTKMIMTDATRNIIDHWIPIFDKLPLPT